MTTATQPTLAPAGTEEQIARPSLARLVQVELRKMTDTRAGFWLLLVTLLLALAGVVLTVAFAPDEDRTFKQLFRTTMELTSLLATVLAILVVTSEWSQRTALSTFTLVPRRERVIAAKLLAVVVFALVIAANCVLLALLGTLVSPGADAWDLSLGEFATGALLQTLGMLGAFAFGLALMSSAPAIVLAYVLPIVFAILAETIPGFRDTADWLDTTVPSEALWTDTGDGTAWAQLATAWALWLGVPLAIGLARLRRVELRLDGRPVEVGERRLEAAEALVDDRDDPPADLAGGEPVEDRGAQRLVAQLQRRADHDRERADRRVVGVAAELAREGAAERLAVSSPISARRARRAGDRSCASWKPRNIS